MNYAAIKKTDVANGPGIRVSLFVSGCTHGCKGCFNREAWDFGYGQIYTDATEEEILQAMAPDYIRGISILGGEPMEPENRRTVLELLRKVRASYPKKDIWCYTGYGYEKDLLRWAEKERGCNPGEPVQSAENENAAGEGGWGQDALPPAAETDGQSGNGENDAAVVTELLGLIDVLVDGEFVEERKNLRLAFRGSDNQRLIDVKASAGQGKAVCLEL